MLILCNSVHINPIAYGGLAYLAYVEDSNTRINDIDLLVSEIELKRIVKLLSKVKIHYKYSPKWHEVQVFKDGLKIEIDSYQFWKINLVDSKYFDFGDLRIKIVSLQNLKNIYKWASENSKDKPKEYHKKYEILVNSTYAKRFKDSTGSWIVIRSVKINDIRQINRVAYDSWKDLPNNKSRTRSQLKPDINGKNQRHSNFIILVAEKDKKIVGFIWGYALDKDKFPVKDNKALANYGLSLQKTAYIDEIAVEHRFRRRGIAGALLDSYKEIRKQNGFEELLLSTKNRDAISLYKKKHYTQMFDLKGKEIVDIEKEGTQTFIYTFLHLKIGAK